MYPRIQESSIHHQTTQDHVTNNQAATTRPTIKQIPHNQESTRHHHTIKNQVVATKQKIKLPPRSQESSHHTTKNQPRIKHTQTPCMTKNQAATTQESKCKQTNGNQIHKQMQASKQASKQMHKQTNIYIKYISKQAK
jgi:hypothetical protein